MTFEELNAAMHRAFEQARHLAASDTGGPHESPPVTIEPGWCVPDERERWASLTAGERRAELAELFGPHPFVPVASLMGILDLDSFDEHGNWREGKRPPDWPEE